MHIDEVSTINSVISKDQYSGRGLIRNPISQGNDEIISLAWLLHDKGKNSIQKKYHFLKEEFGSPFLEENHFAQLFKRGPTSLLSQ